MSQLEHPWLDDLHGVEGILLRQGPLAIAFDSQQIANAFGMYQFFASQDSDAGDGQEFTHSESGVTVCYDGEAAKVVYSSSEAALRDALADLLATLVQLGWENVVVASRQGDDFLEQVGMAMPANVSARLNLVAMSEFDSVGGELDRFARSALEQQEQMAVLAAMGGVDDGLAIPGPADVVGAGAGVPDFGLGVFGTAASGEDFSSLAVPADLGGLSLAVPDYGFGDSLALAPVVSLSAAESVQIQGLAPVQAQTPIQAPIRLNEERLAVPAPSAVAFLDEKRGGVAETVGRVVRSVVAESPVVAASPSAVVAKAAAAPNVAAEFPSALPVTPEMQAAFVDAQRLFVARVAGEQPVARSVQLGKVRVVKQMTTPLLAAGEKLVVFSPSLRSSEVVWNLLDELPEGAAGDALVPALAAAMWPGSRGGQMVLCCLLLAVRSDGGSLRDLARLVGTASPDFVVESLHKTADVGNVQNLNASFRPLVRRLESMDRGMFTHYLAELDELLWPLAVTFDTWSGSVFEDGEKVARLVFRDLLVSDESVVIWLTWDALDDGLWSEWLVSVAVRWAEAISRSERLRVVAPVVASGDSAQLLEFRRMLNGMVHAAAPTLGMSPDALEKMLLASQG